MAELKARQIPSGRDGMLCFHVFISCFNSRADYENLKEILYRLRLIDWRDDRVHPALYMRVGKCFPYESPGFCAI